MSDWGEAFPAVHRALAEEYRDLPQEHVESIVRGVFGPSVGLADAEGFFDDIGRALTQVGRAAAPIAGPALQGALAGGASGAALGPWGALGGALLGGVGSAIGAAQAPRTPGPSRPASPVPAGVIGAVPGPGAPGPAISQLLAALASPTVQDALAALLMGRAGAASVAGAGNQKLRAPAILNMLGMLTGRAAAEAERWESDGERVALPEGLDEADPEARAEWVFGRLALPLSAGEAADGGSGEGWLDDMYDELETEFYAETLAAEMADGGDLDG